MGSWATSPGLPQCFPHFVRRFLHFSCCSALGRGDKTVIPCTKHWYLPRFRLFIQHTAQGCATRHVSQASMMLFATMPKTLVCSAFLPLCMTYCTRMWHKQSFFRFFVQHTAQGCGAGHVVTSVHANCDDAQCAGIYRVFASLYNILRKDVEQEKLSQASLPLASTPEHRYLQRFCLLVQHTKG